MAVDFFTHNEQLTPTVANYLFNQGYSLILTGQAFSITYISQSDTFRHMRFFKHAIYHYLHTTKSIRNAPIPAESGKKSVPEEYCG